MQKLHEDNGEEKINANGYNKMDRFNRKNHYSIVSMSLLIRFMIYAFNKETDGLGLANNVFKIIMFIFAFGIICVLNKWSIPHEIVKTYLILICIILGTTFGITIVKKIKYKNRFEDYKDPATGKVDKELLEEDNFYKTNKFMLVFLGIMLVIVLISKILLKQ